MLLCLMLGSGRESRIGGVIVIDNSNRCCCYQSLAIMSSRDVAALMASIADSILLEVGCVGFVGIKLCKDVR